MFTVFGILLQFYVEYRYMNIHNNNFNEILQLV